MIFSSPTFLFLFLPLVSFIYFFLNRKSQNVFLLFASLFFYAWGEPVYVLLLIGSIAFNYIIGIAIDKSDKPMSSMILGLATVVNLSLLVYFKYFNFFVIDVLQINAISQVSKLPIGISFFTFQAISYLVDIYRGTTKCQKSIVRLGLYISLFPQLIAGPIVRYNEIVDQLSRRYVSLHSYSEGIRRFIIGLSKKVIFANNIGFLANKIFILEPDTIPFSLAWLGAILFSLQIYYDFSGYSDMAIGLGKIFGFNIPENFNFPYKSRSIQEFWRRWHISLSQWFKDYVYIPLGGNRVPAYKVYRNLIIVFLLTGLWHGANWTFIIWGLLHGAFLLFERSTNVIKNTPRVLQHAYVFLILCFTWILFRSPDMTYFMNYAKAMVFPFQGFDYSSLMYFDNYHVLIAIIGLVLSFPIHRNMQINLITTSNQWTNEGFKIIILAFLFLWSIAEMSSTTFSPFIYFRF